MNRRTKYLLLIYDDDPFEVETITCKSMSGAIFIAQCELGFWKNYNRAYAIIREKTGQRIAVFFERKLSGKIAARAMGERPHPLFAPTLGVLDAEKGEWLYGEGGKGSLQIPKAKGPQTSA